MKTASGARQQKRIDELMEQAGQALTDTKYFEAERLAHDALRQAHGLRDYDRMARIALPLQEARRQKRLAAMDADHIYLFDRAPGEGEQVKIEPGCWLVQPPMVGADGRSLREEADRLEIPVLVIVREPTTQLGRWPVVMIGPVTVRTQIPPAEELTCEWFLEASEALGDEAMEQVDSELAAAVRVDRLLDRLETLPEHEKLHQALADACRAAQRECAENERDREKSGKKKKKKPADNS
ncbi:MAG: hypothetical protein EA376_06655 [Phycisphaeraceae bacterium]|nr:MAG: hypothetical protein EA376_06655 [Phycisphaeraceae bacterium]